MPVTRLHSNAKWGVYINVCKILLFNVFVQIDSISQYFTINCGQKDWAIGPGAVA